MTRDVAFGRINAALVVADLPLRMSPLPKPHPAHAIPRPSLQQSCSRVAPTVPESSFDRMPTIEENAASILYRSTIGYSRFGTKESATSGRKEGRSD